MKKVFTSLMLMLFAVLAVNAQSVVYTLDTSLEANKGTDNGYATAGDVTVDGITWNATGNVTMSPWRIGGKGLTGVDREVKTTTAYQSALTKIVLTLGEHATGITVNSVSLSWSDKADFTGAQTISKDYAEVIEFAPEGGFAANSYYKFTINVTVPGSSNKYVTFNKVEFYGEAPSAGWDGTVTTSLDGQTVTSLADFDNMTLTFPGAKSIEILDEEECQYLTLQNENGSELYGIWAPTMGSDYTINGNTITLGGFMAMEGVTVAIPAGTTKLYIEDYGTLAIDGEGQYLETMEFDANIATSAEPFMLTSVSNNGVEGNVINVVEASEQGVMYQFNVTATGKALSKGTATPTLSLLEDATVDFGAADIIAYEAETAYIRFMTLQQPYFTQPGTYVLSIPEGTFVDAEGTPNAAVTVKWAVIAGQTQEINIETVEVGTVDKNFDDITDTYYTATVKFQKPEGAAYAYVEGMQVSLNGETSNVMFMAPDYGFVELGAEEDVTLVFTDGMKAATNDPEFEGDLRQPGSYVATAEIYFMDENQNELPVVAKYTGSIVLPVLSTVELGEPVFSVDNDPYYGMISKGDLEVQGLTMTFPEAEGITPDMQIKVVATLQQYTASQGELDPGFSAPAFENIEGLENVEFNGDAMFGDAVVNMPDFTAYIIANDPTAYMVTVSSIEVIASTGVVASWTANQEEGDVYGTMFEVKADEPAYEIFFDVEDGAEIDLAETKSINVNVGVTDLTGTGADLYIEGMLYGKDGTAQPIFGFTDFEDGVDVNISRLTPGNSYQIVITKIAYGEEVGFDEETYMPIYENEFEDENGLATLNFSIKTDAPSIDATVQVNGTELNVIFPVGTDLGDNYAVKPYILSGSETIQVADYAIDNTTGGFFDPLNLIVITLNAELADGDYTLVLPAGMFIVNGGDNNEEIQIPFTVGTPTSINGIAAANSNVMFNIAGQRVNNAKGIVIMNGKKVVRK